MRMTVNPSQHKKFQTLREYLRILRNNKKLTNKETLAYLLSLMPKEAEEYIEDIEKIEREVLEHYNKGVTKGLFLTLGED